MVRVLPLVLLSASLALATGGPTPGMLVGVGAVLLLLATLFVFSVRAYARIVREESAKSPEAGRKAFRIIWGSQAAILTVGLLLLGTGLLILELIWMAYPFLRKGSARLLAKSAVPHGFNPEAGRDRDFLPPRPDGTKSPREI